LPYPQLRELRICDASTRATLGVVTGPSGVGGGRDKAEAEQGLLDKALKDYWPVFTPRRLWVMDRNFNGAPRIRDMLATRIWCQPADTPSKLDARSGMQMRMFRVQRLDLCR
jgi:hypothetical protein